LQVDLLFDSTCDRIRAAAAGKKIPLPDALMPCGMPLQAMYHVNFSGASLTHSWPIVPPAQKIASYEGMYSSTSACVHVAEQRPQARVGLSRTMLLPELQQMGRVVHASSTGKAAEMVTFGFP